MLVWRPWFVRLGIPAGCLMVLLGLMACTSAPKKGSEPYGTFVQRGDFPIGGGAGNSVKFSWEQTVVLQTDGSAEIATKYSAEMASGWQLAGCADGERSGFVVVNQVFSATMSGTVITLVPRGSMTVSHAEPSCWRYPAFNGNEDPNKAQVLDWVDGRLGNAQGEYVRVQ